jgi:hypothetical protein
MLLRSVRGCGVHCREQDTSLLVDGIVGGQAGEAPGKGTDPTERGLAEGKA